METKFIIMIVMGIAALIITTIIAFFFISTVSQIDTSNTPSTQVSTDWTYLTSRYLTPLGDGITSHSAQSYNLTYLNCDGVNDSILITPTENESLSFWYNSSTSTAWVHVVNNNGLNYTDNVEGNPDEYPVYWNGTSYFFCKTDATTFWEGSIDKIELYPDKISTPVIEELYNEGH